MLSWPEKHRPTTPAELTMSSIKQEELKKLFYSTTNPLSPPRILVAHGRCGTGKRTAIETLLAHPPALSTEQLLQHHQPRHFKITFVDCVEHTTDELVQRVYMHIREATSAEGGGSGGGGGGLDTDWTMMSSQQPSLGGNQSFGSTQQSTQSTQQQQPPNKKGRSIPVLILRNPPSTGDRSGMKGYLLPFRDALNRLAQVSAPRFVSAGDAQQQQQQGGGSLPFVTIFLLTDHDVHSTKSDLLSRLPRPVHSLASFFHVPPVTEIALKKRLTAIVDAEKLASRITDKTAVPTIAEAAEGDIRHALLQLEWYVLPIRDAMRKQQKQLEDLAMSPVGGNRGGGASKSAAAAAMSSSSSSNNKSKAKLASGGKKTAVLSIFDDPFATPPPATPTMIDLDTEEDDAKMMPSKGSSGKKGKTASSKQQQQPSPKKGKTSSSSRRQRDEDDEEKTKKKKKNGTKQSAVDVDMIEDFTDDSDVEEVKGGGGGGGGKNSAAGPKKPPNSAAAAASSRNNGSSDKKKKTTKSGHDDDDDDAILADNNNNNKESGQSISVRDEIASAAHTVGRLLCNKRTAEYSLARCTAPPRKLLGYLFENAFVYFDSSGIADLCKATAAMSAADVQMAERFFDGGHFATSATNARDTSGVTENSEGERALIVFHRQYAQLKITIPRGGKTQVRPEAFMQPPPSWRDGLPPPPRENGFSVSSSDQSGGYADPFALDEEDDESNNRRHHLFRRVDHLQRLSGLSALTHILERGNVIQSPVSDYRAAVLDIGPMAAKILFDNSSSSPPFMNLQQGKNTTGGATLTQPLPSQQQPQQQQQPQKKGPTRTLFVVKQQRDAAAKEAEEAARHRVLSQPAVTLLQQTFIPQRLRLNSKLRSDYRVVPAPVPGEGVDIFLGDALGGRRIDPTLADPIVDDDDDW